MLIALVFYAFIHRFLKNYFFKVHVGKGNCYLRNLFYKLSHLSILKEIWIQKLELCIVCLVSAPRDDENEMQDGKQHSGFAGSKRGGFGISSGKI